MSISLLIHSALEHGWYGVRSDNKMVFLHDNCVTDTDLASIRKQMVKQGYPEYPVDNEVHKMLWSHGLYVGRNTPRFA